MVPETHLISQSLFVSWLTIHLMLKLMIKKLAFGFGSIFETRSDSTLRAVFGRSQLDVILPKQQVEREPFVVVSVVSNPLLSKLH